MIRSLYSAHKGTWLGVRVTTHRTTDLIFHLTVVYSELYSNIYTVKNDGLNYLNCDNSLPTPDVIWDPQPQTSPVTDDGWMESTTNKAFY